MLREHVLCFSIPSSGPSFSPPFRPRRRRERATRKTGLYRHREFHSSRGYRHCLDRKCRNLEFPSGLSGEKATREILTSRSARKKCQASLCHTIAQFQSSAGKLNAFGIGAFALRHRPGEVPTISRKPRLKAGWSVNPTSNATVSKESFEYNMRDFAASTRL